MSTTVTTTVTTPVRTEMATLQQALAKMARNGQPDTANPGRHLSSKYLTDGREVSLNLSKVPSGALMGLEGCTPSDNTVVQEVLPSKFASLQVGWADQKEHDEGWASFWDGIRKHAQRIGEQKETPNNKISLYKTRLRDSVAVLPKEYDDELLEQRNLDDYSSLLGSHIQDTMDQYREHSKLFEEHHCKKQTYDKLSDIGKCYVDAIKHGIDMREAQSDLRGSQAMISLWKDSMDESLGELIKGKAMEMADALAGETGMRQVVENYAKRCHPRKTSFNLHGSFNDAIRHFQTQSAHNYTQPADDDDNGELGETEYDLTFEFDADAPEGERLKALATLTLKSAPDEKTFVSQLERIPWLNRPVKGESSILGEAFEELHVRPRLAGIPFSHELRRELLGILTLSHDTLKQVSDELNKAIEKFGTSPGDPEVELQNLIDLCTSETAASGSYENMEGIDQIWNLFNRAYMSNAKKLKKEQTEREKTDPDIAGYTGQWLDLALRMSDPELVSQISGFELRTAYPVVTNNKKTMKERRARAEKQKGRIALEAKTRSELAQEIQDFKSDIKNNLGIEEVSSDLDEFITSLKLAVRPEEGLQQVKSSTTNSDRPGRFVDKSHLDERQVIIHPRFCDSDSGLLNRTKFPAISVASQSRVKQLLPDTEARNLFDQYLLNRLNKATYVDGRNGKDSNEYDATSWPSLYNPPPFESDLQDLFDDGSHYKGMLHRRQSCRRRNSLPAQWDLESLSGESLPPDTADSDRSSLCSDNDKWREVDDRIEVAEGT